MGRVVVSGNLQAGPNVVSEGVFPSMQATAIIALREGSQGKSADRMTGVLSRRINSAAAFVPLQGVGPTDTVTQGDFLYLKCDNAIDLRLTVDDGAGGQTVITLEGIRGLVILEFDTTQPLELLEAQGVTALEYFVSGPS